MHAVSVIIEQLVCLIKVSISKKYYFTLVFIYQKNLGNIDFLQNYKLFEDDDTYSS